MSEEEDYQLVCSTIDERKEFLHGVSRAIWESPELAYKELKAHSILTDALRCSGFNVQEHYVVDTAFSAEFTSPSGDGPVIAFVLEYDALPELGHACGHNLIAEAGLAAAIAVREAMLKDPDIPGKVLVMGSPAEESGGGKIALLKAGAFEGVDVALMAHPTRENALYPLHVACYTLTVQYRGKEAHATAAPWEGRNALDAAVACYQAIALLRQHVRPFCSVNVILTEGGVAANTIPGESALRVMVRAATRSELRSLVSRVEACARGAAMATGCEVAVRPDEATHYEDVLHNRVVGELFRRHAGRLGSDFSVEQGNVVASTDMGNVSHKVPTIHPLFAIESSGVNHSPQFSIAAGSDASQPPTLVAAKAMAMTALDLLRSPDKLLEAKAKFDDQMSREDDL